MQPVAIVSNAAVNADDYSPLVAAAVAVARYTADAWREAHDGPVPRDHLLGAKGGAPAGRHARAAVAVFGSAEDATVPPGALRAAYDQLPATTDRLLVVLPDRSHRGLKEDHVLSASYAAFLACHLKDDDGAPKRMMLARSAIEAAGRDAATGDALDFWPQNLVSWCLAERRKAAAGGHSPSKQAQAQGHGHAKRPVVDVEWTLPSFGLAFPKQSSVVSPGQTVAITWVCRGPAPKRLAIDGGSAGGYTTLGALAFKDTFTAGCSLYGVRVRVRVRTLTLTLTLTLALTRRAARSTAWPTWARSPRTRTSSRAATSTAWSGRGLGLGLGLALTLTLALALALALSLSLALALALALTLTRWGATRRTRACTTSARRSTRSSNSRA